MTFPRTEAEILAAAKERAAQRVVQSRIARVRVSRVSCLVQVNVAQSSGFDVYTRLSVSLSAEAALGHVVAGVEGDYRRRVALARRRQLMQQWADFIERPWQHGDNVVPIGAALFA